VIEFSFQVPDVPWSTNQDRNLHPQERAARIQTWKYAKKLWFRQAVIQQHLKTPLPPSIVQIVIPFTVKRRRDPHNYCGTVLKAVIDGLVKGGAWPDDTPEYVGHRESELYVGNQVIVRIFDMKEGI